MKKAEPSPTRPRQSRFTQMAAEWERKIAAFDRAVRRSNYRFKTHVVRLDPAWVEFIAADRTINFERLNDLPPVSEGSKPGNNKQTQPSASGADLNVALQSPAG